VAEYAIAEGKDLPFENGPFDPVNTYSFSRHLFSVCYSLYVLGARRSRCVFLPIPGLRYEGIEKGEFFMNRALSVPPAQEASTDRPNAASADEIWEPLDLLAEESAGLTKWRGFAVDGQVIPSYVFIGRRGGSVPIRLGLLGRLEPEDLVSTSAILKLLVDLDLAPLLAKDFALFCYPAANPARVSRRSPDFSTDFWTDAPDPTIRYFEHELAGNKLDGIIAAKGNEAISGFQIQVSSRVIATEVLWPALEIVQKFIPLAAEPIQVFPPLQNSQHSLFSLGQSRPGAFSLMIRTPRDMPFENQISAIVFSVKQILHHYRTLVDYANKL
jgi:hypothetical protein